jgi:hypothetical protein
MTDREFTLFVAAITALPTIIFTGFVAFWSWERDQERLILKKVSWAWQTATGASVLAKGVAGGILVRNLSLFPVRVKELGFAVGGKGVSITRGGHGDEWPVELASHSDMVVNFDQDEWQEVLNIGYGEDVLSPQFVAEALTETGRKFTSNTLDVMLKRILGRTRTWITDHAKGRTMKRIIVIICMLPLLSMALGCSSKLTRRESKHMIDEQSKVRPFGPNNAMVHGHVPGFVLAESDTYYTVDEVQLGRYGVSTGSWGPGQTVLANALAKTGYVTAIDGGPINETIGQFTFNAKTSRTVALTQKGASAFGYVSVPAPTMQGQAHLPELSALDDGYEVTGIVQDGVRAKVNILIPWHLTRIALDIQPYARKGDYSSGRDDRWLWEKFLDNRPASGTSAATILFQKFDDGWRIVDEDGKSEKDFH